MVTDGAAQVTTSFEDVKADFGFLEDWEDRYRYIIELGRDMPPLDPALKTEGARVHGCASQVWLIPHIEGSGPQARLSFQGDSDAMIVRGLIALLRILINGRTAAEIATLDAVGALSELGLEQHLSAQRSNGLRAMVARIRELAAAAAAQETE